MTVHLPRKKECVFALIIDVHQFARQFRCRDKNPCGLPPESRKINADSQLPLGTHAAGIVSCDPVKSITASAYASHKPATQSSQSWCLSTYPLPACLRLA